MALLAKMSLTLLLVALFSLTISATTITTITTTIVDENASKCTQKIQPMQQLNHCMMYISPKMSPMNAQEEHKERCCSQFKNIKRSCRCMAIKEMVREQQQQGQMESEEREQMVKDAMNIPSKEEEKDKKEEEEREKGEVYFSSRITFIVKMSNVNRGWMSRHMKSNRITLTDEYKNGVEEFLDSAKRFGLTKDKTLCPCKNCGNGHWENLDTIKFHLYASGFFESYTVWTLHGEKEPTTESRRTRHRKRRAPPIVEPPVDMFGLLRDSFGQDFYSFNDMRGSNSSSMNDAEESPNFDASQFYTDANESGAPIYPGDHKLPVSYYAMKKMVKKLKLGYEKIDVCLVVGQQKGRWDARFVLEMYKVSNSRIAENVVSMEHVITPIFGIFETLMNSDFADYAD
ncbi:hypothetical protein AgCh_014242 [Apium graveolens]